MAVLQLYFWIISFLFNGMGAVYINLVFRLIHIKIKVYIFIHEPQQYILDWFPILLWRSGKQRKKNLSMCFINIGEDPKIF